MSSVYQIDQVTDNFVTRCVAVSDPSHLDKSRCNWYAIAVMRNIILALFIALFFLFAPTLFFGVEAAVVSEKTSTMGMHLMNISELEEAKELIGGSADSDTWQYVTIPFTLSDLDRTQEWQDFFDQARELQIIPLVRLATRYDPAIDAWEIPTRKDIVQQVTVLSLLRWPTEQRHVMVFNEVNHAKEWENTLDPVGYAETLRFASSWMRSEGKHYVVLPAAMDLAAPNGPVTREAFTYLEAMKATDSEIFAAIDGINSHSYPNPGFSASPYRTGQNSLRGFEHEITYFKEATGRDLPVYITETGWDDRGRLSGRLVEYYQYALTEIWSHPQVVTVTPFVLRGDPGPFSGFSFVKGDGTPTKQYTALQTAMQRVAEKAQWLSQAE